MRKILKGNQFTLTKNQCFKQVINNCATAKRKEQDGTWITDTMMNAYVKLKEQGIAVSYEVWEENQLVAWTLWYRFGECFLW